MRRLFLLAGLLSGLAAPVFAGVPATGQPAPAFRLQDQNGRWQGPADHLGHWLVLYFYPKDFTPGCTTEVCTFRDDVARLRKAEGKSIPAWFDYKAVSGLSREMQETLQRVRPSTLGQASRIAGVTPAAVSLLHIYIEIQSKRQIA